MHNHIRLLQKIVSRRGSSKVLSFGEPHVLMAIQLLNNEGHVSRKRFCERLKIGEGAVKTLISHLKKEGLADSVRAGTFLTIKGKNFVNAFLQIMSSECYVYDSAFSKMKNNHAILLRRFGTHIKLGIEQRDAAIIYGASSAMTMLFKKCKFVFPGEDSDCLISYPKTKKILLEKLRPDDGDVVIFVAAKDPFTAEIAAKNSVIYTLNK